MISLNSAIALIATIDPDIAESHTYELVSGDGDFYPALQAAKDQGKHVEIAAFETNISPETSRLSSIVNEAKDIVLNDIA